MVNYPISKAAIDKLRARGFRVTPQRRLILKLLEEAGEHLDAGKLYQHARTHDQSISLATVYRTLSLLLKAGLVEQRFLDQDRSRSYYEIAEDEHFHFTCLDCGKVIEFETDLVAKICEELHEKCGLEVQYTRVHFEGTCSHYPDCDNCPFENGN